jgi:hypothetical protein
MNTRLREAASALQHEFGQTEPHIDAAVQAALRVFGGVLLDQTAVSIGTPIYVVCCCSLLFGQSGHHRVDGATGSRIERWICDSRSDYCASESRVRSLSVSEHRRISNATIVVVLAHQPADPRGHSDAAGLST